ncbi:MAG: GNAT family N-acetyltransferase [Pseudomonadota bacterium]
MQAILCNEAQHLSGEIVPAGDVRFSHLDPTDQKALTDHFASLSPEDLRFRFGSPVSQAWVARYLAGILEAPGQVLAAWADGNIYALGELRPAHRGPEDACEIAMSVLKPFRNQGVGTALLNTLLEDAMTMGFAYAHLQVIDENRPMRRICRNLQAECARFGPDLIYSFSIGPCLI